MVGSPPAHLRPLHTRRSLTSTHPSTPLFSKRNGSLSSTITAQPWTHASILHISSSLGNSSPITKDRPRIGSLSHNFRPPQRRFTMTYFRSLPGAGAKSGETFPGRRNSTSGSCGAGPIPACSSTSGIIGSRASASAL